MNYLAHIFLSGDDDDLKIGNFIADHVKPTQRMNYSAEIRSGMHLHYAIDTYTDNHSLVSAGKKRLHPHLHKYTPVVVDVLYDHFLARHWSEYHHLDLLEYTHLFYSLLHTRKNLLPDKTKYILNYMEPRNWLYNYQHMSELEKIFAGMSRRANFENNISDALKYIKKDYDLFEEEFRLFFAQLSNHCLMVKNDFMPQL